MNINDFLGITIVGVILSFIVEAIQRIYGTSSMKTRALTIVLAIIVGGAYFYLRQTVWWATIIGVLAAASTVYAMIFSGRSSQQAITSPEIDMTKNG